MYGKDVLRGLIEIYQNDFESGYEGEDKNELRIVFLNLILEVTRYVNEFRYCPRVDCPCSPESAINHILKNHKEKLWNNPYILGNNYPLTDVPITEIRRFLESFEKGE
ncbi:MAG TPA: hypothetical protein VIK94_01040 [Bacilli bacterium]